MWPFRRTEKRDFTQIAYDRALAAAQGSTSQADATMTAATTTAAGAVSRAFAAASVQPSMQRTGLTAEVLHLIGMAYIINGESVWIIDVVDGGVQLTRAQSWYVEGRGAGPWRYQVNVPGPTKLDVRYVPDSQVIHPRVNCAPATPHIGRSPLELAGFSAKALANAERQLAEELSGPVGRLIPFPGDQVDITTSTGENQLDTLKAQIGSLKGDSALVPSMAQRWADGPRGGTGDWQSRRIGADPPDSVVTLNDDGHNRILAALGVPPAMFAARAEATAGREALRQFLHMCVSPLARVLEVECSRKLGTDVALDFTELHASDVQGRARAFKSLVDGGMSLSDAAAASGILSVDE